jgi:hypothetical protein
MVKFHGGLPGVPKAVYVDYAHPLVNYADPGEKVLARWNVGHRPPESCCDDRQKRVPPRSESAGGWNRTAQSIPPPVTSPTDRDEMRSFTEERCACAAPGPESRQDASVPVLHLRGGGVDASGGRASYGP